MNHLPETLAKHLPEMLVMQGTLPVNVKGCLVLPSAVKVIATIATSAGGIGELHANDAVASYKRALET